MLEPQEAEGPLHNVTFKTEGGLPQGRVRRGSGGVNKTPGKKPKRGKGTCTGSVGRRGGNWEALGNNSKGNEKKGGKKSSRSVYVEGWMIGSRKPSHGEKGRPGSGVNNGILGKMYHHNQPGGKRTAIVSERPRWGSDKNPQR